MNGRALVVAAFLTVGLCWASDHAYAQKVEHGRGNIVSVDQDRATIELRDTKNHVASWRFQRDAKVKFTDGAAFFPNPSVRDLRQPMYVHYTFVNQLIDSFDVVELGFRPGTTDTGGKYKQQGIPRTVTGLVSAYDARVRQVAVDHHGLTEAFQLTDRSDQRLDPGVQIELRTSWSGQQELVSELRILSAPASQKNSDDRSRQRHGHDK